MICMKTKSEIGYIKLLKICVRNNPSPVNRIYLVEQLYYSQICQFPSNLILVNIFFFYQFNAGNSLGLGSKKCLKHFTLVNNTYRFLLLFCWKYLERKINLKKIKHMHKMESIKTSEKNTKHFGKMWCPRQGLDLDFTRRTQVY